MPLLSCSAVVKCGPLRHVFFLFSSTTKDALILITYTFSSLLWLSLSPLKPEASFVLYIQIQRLYLYFDAFTLQALWFFCTCLWETIKAWCFYVYSRCPVFILLSSLCCPQEVHEPDCIHGRWCTFIGESRHFKLNYPNNFCTDF